jgi:hypothetical protein
LSDRVLKRALIGRLLAQHIIERCGGVKNRDNLSFARDATFPTKGLTLASRHECKPFYIDNRRVICSEVNRPHTIKQGSCRVARSRRGTTSEPFADVLETADILPECVLQTLF